MYKRDRKQEKRKKIRARRDKLQERRKMEKVKRGRMKKGTPVTSLTHAAVRVTNVAKKEFWECGHIEK